MKMPFLSRDDELKEFPRGQEFVCILDENTERVDMLVVYHSTSQELHTVDKIFPRAEAMSRFLPEGGVIHFFNCSPKYLKEVEHFSELEQSVVLRHLMSFDQPKTHNWTFYVMAALMLLVVLIMS